jgi:hypothetical protein
MTNIPVSGRSNCDVSNLSSPNSKVKRWTHQLGSSLHSRRSVDSLTSEVFQLQYCLQQHTPTVASAISVPVPRFKTAMECVCKNMSFVILQLWINHVPVLIHNVVHLRYYTKCVPPRRQLHLC